MKFRAGSLEFNATVAESGEIVSPQTGAQLRALTIQFRAQKAGMHEQALDAAQARPAGGLFSLTETDDPELEWRIRDSTSQYVGTEPWGVNHHVWRIEQVERVSCARLIIAGIELTPDEYADAVGEDGSVRLAARASTSEVDLARLAAVEGPVDVVRDGISETARRMTVDYVWGATAAGLAVVVRCIDVPEQRLTLDAALMPGDPLADLLEVLVGRGVLSGADRLDLRNRRHAARRVRDVDGWRLRD